MEAFELSPVIATTQSVVLVDIIIFVGQENDSNNDKHVKRQNERSPLELF
jgi:hypothetical protein